MSLRVSLGKSGRGLLLGKVCFARESNFKEVILPLFQTKVEIFRILWYLPCYKVHKKLNTVFYQTGEGSLSVKIWLAQLEKVFLSPGTCFFRRNFPNIEEEFS